jgi:sugar lactone lactonase YvrE
VVSRFHARASAHECRWFNRRACRFTCRRATSFVDDLDIDQRRIWFSDASQRFDYTQVALDFFEGSRTGRLLRYDPKTQTAEVMMEGLFFANGVTLGPDEDLRIGQRNRVWVGYIDCG